MFSTYSATENHFKSAILGDGQQVWSYIRLYLSNPWFIVVYEDMEDGTLYRETVLLDTFFQILDINEIKTIIEVYIVSPSHMNGQGRWMMNPLIEILEGIEPEADGQKAQVYVVENGERYMASYMSTLEENLLQIEIIFKLN